MRQDDLDHVFENTRDVWPPFAGARIFLTGGTGFVGRWLTETFLYANRTLALGAHLYLLSRRRSPEKRPSITYLQGDFRTFPVPADPPDYLIHAAIDQDGNVEGLRHVLQMQPKRTLYLSSGAVYENPLSAYGAEKRACEKICRGAVIARLFTFVGPYLPLDAQYAVGNFIRDALNGQPIRVQDGRPLRSYLYAADLAIWLWTLLAHAQPGTCYDVGGSEPIAIRDLAHLVAQWAGSAAGVIESPQPINFPPRMRYLPDIKPALDELSLRPRIPLEAAVRRTLEWHKSNRC